MEDFIAFALMSVMIMTSCCVEQSHGDWSIDGGCPEPTPISNTYRKVTESKVTYSCVSGSLLESGDLELRCESSFASYDGSWPVCQLDCGEPLTWSWAPIFLSSGSKVGNMFAYICSSVTYGVRIIGAVCTAEAGWVSGYPNCPESTNFADDMDVIAVNDTTTSIIQDGNCFQFVSFKDGEYSIGFHVRDTSTHPLINVARLVFSVDTSVENDWLQNTSLLFKRHGFFLEQVEIQNTPGYQTIVVDISSPVRAVSEIYFSSSVASSIKFCDLQVIGNSFEGGCADPIPPFTTKLIANQTGPYYAGNITYFECEDDFLYIGGTNKYRCHYNRSWMVYGNEKILECTDRPNQALGAIYTINVTRIQSDYIDTSNNNVELLKDIYNGSEILLHDASETAAFTIYFEDTVAVERLTIELPDGQEVSTMKAYQNSSRTNGSSCKASVEYQNDNFYTFVCNTYSHTQAVEVEIVAHDTISTGTTTSKHLFNIKSVVVIGETIHSDSKNFECYVEKRGCDYKGIKNQTVDGENCLPWKLYDFHIESFPDWSLDEASNYCRNPDPQNHSNPFCMTVNGPKTCPVPPCQKICATTQRGEHYLGRINKTKDSNECMVWSSSGVPFVRSSEFPDESLSDAENNCRNPGLSQSRPWCYVSLYPHIAEHCSIPSCPNAAIIEEKIDSDGAEEYIDYVQNKHMFRCYMFDKFNQTLGTSAWIEVTLNILNGSCELSAPGANIYLVCVEQSSVDDEFSWYDWIIVCPSTTTESPPRGRAEKGTTIEIDTKTDVNTTVSNNIISTTSRTRKPTSADTTISSLSDTTISSSPDTTLSSMPDTTLSSMPDTTISSMPDTTLSSMPDTTLSSMPDTTLSSMPDTTLSSMPDTTLSSMPDTTLPTIPDSMLPLSTQSPTSEPAVSSTTLPSTAPSTSSFPRTSSTTSATHPTATVNSTSTEECSCSCSHAMNITLDAETIEALRNELVKRLSVDRTKLSASVRAKTSATDNRETAVTTGFAGVALMVTVASSIIVPDAIALLTNVGTAVFGRNTM